MIATMHKPHIAFNGLLKVWICSSFVAVNRMRRYSGPYAGIGNTPMEAFEDWESNRLQGNTAIYPSANELRGSKGSSR